MVSADGPMSEDDEAAVDELAPTAVRRAQERTYGHLHETDGDQYPPGGPTREIEHSHKNGAKPHGHHGWTWLRALEGDARGGNS